MRLDMKFVAVQTLLFKVGERKGIVMSGLNRISENQTALPRRLLTRQGLFVLLREEDFVPRKRLRIVAPKTQGVHSIMNSFGQGRLLKVLQNNTYTAIPNTL